MSKKTEIGCDTCGHCNLKRSPEGHDGCLGTLPGDVMNACCGHGGNAEGAYIQYWNKPRIAGKEATQEQNRLINT